MKKLSYLLLIIFISLQITAQPKLEDVKSEKFDTGKMWSFDYPPIEHLEKTYGFKADQSWFDDVRLSALRLPGCTSSFVSADGLMMTNHHCVRGVLDRLNQEGEDIVKNGFFAKELTDERKIPNYYADQLVLIKDVTAEVALAAATGSTSEEKAKNKEDKIKELTESYKNETGLTCQIVSLFNGAKFSLYGYKRYNDIRLVFVPDMPIAYFGGDFDNFTYPRYNLDCAFLRAYENDQPVNSSENFFQFSTAGIQEGEPIFTVGNPGTTQRLKTISQLEYYRDVTYKNNAYMLDTYYNMLEELKKTEPSRAAEFEEIKVQIGNSQKVITTIYKGLTDPYLMARKKDFQKKLQEAVWNNPNLKDKYGKVWENIDKTRMEMRNYGPKITAYTFGRLSAQYFNMAQKLFTLAEELKKSEEERLPEYKAEKLSETIKSIYPEKFDALLENTKLAVQADLISMNLGGDKVNNLFGGKKGKEAAEFMLKNSVFRSREAVIKLAESGADNILSSKDPVLLFVKEAKEQLPELQKQSKEVTNTEQEFDDMLGRAIFEVYGTSIPPDANFTLRVSDGTLASFDYNGTKAPLFTTFYGLYDRWYSFNKQYPWNLNDNFASKPADLDLNTPFNFISTNDIVGGNSGSAIINKNAEVVGLAFDGNMDSIVGNFIYMPHNNRCVAVDSRAMVTSIDKVYKAERIAKELKDGKMKK